MDFDETVTERSNRTLERIATSLGLPIEYFFSDLQLRTVTASVELREGISNVTAQETAELIKAYRAIDCPIARGRVLQTALDAAASDTI